MTENKLTHEEKLINEQIFALMGEETLQTVSSISNTLKISVEIAKRMLYLFEQEREAERVVYNNQEFWQLTLKGKSTSRILQRAYLGGDENYQPKELAMNELTSEHFAILEYFEGSTKENPKRLSDSIIQSHTSRENPYFLEYPLFYDLLESTFLSQVDDENFKLFYANAFTEKALKIKRGYTLSWEQLSEYQKELLQLLLNTTYEKPLSFRKMEQINPKYNLLNQDADKQWEELIWAQLMEHSLVEDEDCSAFYILPKGKKLLQKQKEI
jgi:hypothetical protein